MKRTSSAAAFVLLAFVALAQDSRPVRREWQVDGLKREALVYAPPSAKDSPAPVVFAFHGHGGSMQNGTRMFRFHESWPEAICVYPQGLPTPGRLTDPEGERRGWQHTIGAEGDRDLRFFDAMWASLRAEFRVDDSRVYVTGHSNGGGFTYLLWAARGSLFAAVAPSSAVPSREELPLLEPKPVLHVAGEKDTLVKFAWQRVAMDALKRLNRCETEGQQWAKFATLYPGPGGCSVTTLIHPGGHAMPPEVPALMVSFFKEHRKRASESRRGAAESAPASRDR
jgi:polyhydroxybutyrate depolymerase